MREGVIQRRGRRQGQPRLAHPAGAGQRDQPHVRPGNDRQQALHVVITPDQRRGRHRQAGVSAEALQRGEVLPQARGGQLIDAFRRADILQPVEPQVPDRRPVRQRARPLERWLGQHHLAAVRGRCDPRGPVHIHPDIAVLVPGHLPAMQAHPDPDRIPARPVMGGQGALRSQTARHRVGGGLERHEEAVSLGGYLTATPGLELRAQQDAMIRQRFPVPVTETAQQRGRTLDVAEQHRDGTVGQFPHPPIIAANPRQLRLRS